MSLGSPTDLNDFKHRVDCRTLALDLDGDDGKEDDLHRGTGGVPEGARHAKLVGDVRRLEQRRRPGPLGDNVRSCEAGRDAAACCREGLRIVARLLLKMFTA